MERTVDFEANELVRRLGTAVRCPVILLAFFCVVAMEAPAARAGSVQGSSILVAMDGSATMLSRDELFAESARGLVAAPPVRVEAPLPAVRLWDEVGAPRALPAQGNLSITISGGRAAP